MLQYGNQRIQRVNWHNIGTTFSAIPTIEQWFEPCKNTVKTQEQITNAEYQHLAGAIQRTSARELMELVRKGLVIKIGSKGRSAHYVLNPKRDANRTNTTNG